MKTNRGIYVFVGIKEKLKMNIASFVVLGIVVAFLVISIISFRKKSMDGCDGNCSACVYSCHKEDFKL